MTEKEKEERISDTCSDETDDDITWCCSCCQTVNSDKERVCTECGKYRF
ncbi:MAG: hypothetical protein IJ385_01060 [Ruminiclostridium sp.]|nr:hypothetical protein [Ruminiclostridium sp.]